jgi:hypothetical protein
MMRASSSERCDVLDGDSHNLPMAARTNPAGEWCSPTREIPNSRLIRLIDESRHCEVVVEMIQDTPTRKCPATALELLEHAGRNSKLIDLRSLADPDALAIAQEAAAPDPGPAMRRSEPEVEQATATPTHAPMTANAMPTTAAVAQSITTSARRGRKRVASVRLLLCLGVLVFLCLGVLVLLGLNTWDMTDTAIYVSLEL